MLAPKEFKAYTKATEVKLGGKKLLFVPWICADNKDHTLDLIKKTDATTVFGHLELQGFQMYKNLPAHGGDSVDMFAKFEDVYSGHFHTRSKSGNVQYLGAACEYSWSDFDDARGFNIYDTKTGKMKFIQNPISIFKKVYYDDLGKKQDDIMNIDFAQYKNCIIKVIVVNKTNPYWFDTFIEKLENDTIELQVIEDNLSLDNLDDDVIVSEAESTLDIFSKYIDALDNQSVNKTKLMSVVNNVYTEALTIEG